MTARTPKTPTSPRQLGERGCGALNEHGEPCAAPALAGSDRCAAHTLGKMQHARRAGGRARAAGLDRKPLDLGGPLDSTAGLVLALERIAHALAGKDLDARTGNALGMVLGTLGRLLPLAPAPAWMAGLPPAVARKVAREGPPQGAFTLKVVVDDTPETCECPGCTRRDLPPAPPKAKA